MPLGRLRVQRELTEIRAADLRFTVEEAGVFLNELMALALSIGLLIDEVFGQRRFLDSDAEPAELEEDSPLHRLVSRRHRVGTA